MGRTLKEVSELRARLESISAELAVMRRVMPVHELRIHQVMDRTGLDGLLVPALEEVSTINEGIDAIAQQVSAALTQLL